MMIYLIIIPSLFLTAYLIFRGQALKLQWAKRRLEPRVVLEINPAASGQSQTKSMVKFFHGLHRLHLIPQSSLPWRRRRQLFSLEIVANRTKGIRFLMIVPSSQEPVVRRLIAGYDWALRVKVVPNYRWDKSKNFRLLSFYPKIKNPQMHIFDLNEDQDSLSYLLSSLVQLKDNEQIAYQIICHPQKDGYISSNWFGKLGQIPLKVFYGLFNTAHQGPLPSSTNQAAMQNTEIQGAFKVNLRVLVQADNASRSREQAQNLQSALNLMGNFKVSSRTNRWQLAYFRMRLLLPGNASFLLTVDQLAGLYHLPSLKTISFEDLNTSLSKTLPIAPEMKIEDADGVVIGDNLHQENQTPISLSALERSRHVYIVGGTGSGKTTMMKYKIIQDIEAGRGVGVIDPHGDLATELLGYIPKARIKDVIYFNPSDYKHPLGINLLEIPPNLNDLELLRAKDLVAETIVSIFRKVFTEENKGGHRIEYVLRNAVHTALYVKDATFFTIFRLLNDNSYNKKIVHSCLDNEDLKSFWLNEMHKAGNFQRVKMQAGVTAKMGRFLFSQAAKNVFGQTEKCLNFNNIITQNKILICNFSKGALGEDTSKLFGASVMAKIQLAILEQAHLTEKARTPFYLYVDEFQNFATRGFIEMLSESRKYKLNLILAEQSTQQQDNQRFVEVILANVGTVVAFKSGSPTDAKILLPLFDPYIQLSEFINLPAFNFYAKLSALNPREPISGITKLVANPPDQRRRSAVIQYSRRKFANKAKLNKA